MNTSIFYIKGISSAYWNLEQAIKEAKLHARCDIINDFNILKNRDYDTRITDENIEDCVLKYRVTVGAGGSIKVKATGSISCDNYWSTGKKKSITFSKTYIIYTLSIAEREEGITFELPFAKK